LKNCVGSGGELANGQHFINFCLATDLLVNDPEKLEFAMRKFCENKKRFL
jgi:hypothetical protein